MEIICTLSYTSTQKIQRDTIPLKMEKLNGRFVSPFIHLNIPIYRIKRPEGVAVYEAEQGAFFRV